MIYNSQDLFVDKLTQFSLRSPELQSTIDTIGNCYRWFYIIMDKELKSDQMKTGIKNELKETLWVDVIQLQVKLQRKSIKVTNGLVQYLGVL